MPRLIGVVEAAQVLRLTASRARKLIVDGRLPATKVGHSWVLSEEDVVEFAQKTRRPGRPLWGSWLFEDLAPDVRAWLVDGCYRVRAQAADQQTGEHVVRVAFDDRTGTNQYWIQDTGRSKSLADKWSSICWALERWAVEVMNHREVLVVRKWQPGQPPGHDWEELAYVEDGPRVGGPPVPRVDLSPPHA